MNLRSFWTGLGYTACAYVIVFDLAQVLLLPWKDKHVGALLGAVLYFFLALTVLRFKAARWVAALMPIVPSAVLLSTYGPAPLSGMVPMKGDLYTALVLVGQLVVAAWALRLLRRP